MNMPISRQTREKMYELVHNKAVFQGCFNKERSLPSVCEALIERFAALDDDERAGVILHHGAGGTVEEFWNRGSEVAAYLLDGKLPAAPEHEASAVAAASYEATATEHEGSKETTATGYPLSSNGA